MATKVSFLTMPALEEEGLVTWNYSEDSSKYTKPEVHVVVVHGVRSSRAQCLGRDTKKRHCTQQGHA